VNWGGKLFTRIFLGFWLITTAVLASWMLANQYFESRPGAALEHRPAGPPRGFILQMIYDLQNVEASDLPNLIERARDEHEVDIYLLTRRGEDLLERAVPTEVRRVAGELRGPRRRAHLSAGGAQLLAFDIYRADRGALHAVFVFKPAAHRLLRLLGSSLWLRITLAVVISGLLCFGLSRLMTRRLKALQGASRRLADGDLTARLQVRRRGGDETDELARDFNSMAQQLQTRVEAQKRLLGDVSHELRSPLARLRVALALAQEYPADITRHLQRIERETERLEELIGQLLASQAGDIALDDQLDLVELLQQLTSDANYEGANQGKRLVLEHDCERALVASNGDLLRQGLENILRNALHHTPPESEVQVSLAAVGDEYHLQVQDCGGGVPEPELDRIFDAFYRTDTARARDTGGYGLGLAIARRAVLQHGGRIQARNTRAGLAVSVQLPRKSMPD
jgi:two-component system sensor histidine kinase CpxA